METQRKGNTCTSDYSIKVMNNHAGRFDSTYRDYVFTNKRSIKLPWGEGCLGYPRPYSWGLKGKVTLWKLHCRLLSDVLVTELSIKFGNAVLSTVNITVSLPSTLITKMELFENTLRKGGIWKCRFCLLYVSQKSSEHMISNRVFSL